MLLDLGLNIATRDGDVEGVTFMKGEVKWLS